MGFAKMWEGKYLSLLESITDKNVRESIKSDIQACMEGLECGERISKIIEVMDKHTGGEDKYDVISSCGRNCITPDVIETGKKCKESAKDIDELIDMLNKKFIGGGQLKRDGNVIMAEYCECYCPIASKNKSLSPMFCNCSKGWFQEFFSSVLNTNVKVNIISSVLRGDPSCKFEIYLESCDLS